ncbi:MAG: hypothetical protein ACLQBQ_09550 [Smithella sp.]
MNNLDVYDKLRPTIQTGDLIEWAGTDLLDKAIRLKTGYDVNHSSMVVLDNDLTGLIVRDYEALADGIDSMPLSIELATSSGHVYYYPLLPEFSSLEQRTEYNRIALRYERTPYDYISIAKILFLGHRKIEEGKLFCSEFVEICHGAKDGDTAYYPGELPEKMKHWGQRIQLY